MWESRGQRDWTHFIKTHFLHDYNNQSTLLRISLDIITSYRDKSPHKVSLPLNTLHWWPNFNMSFEGDKPDQNDSKGETIS
jgi:hypothetical protein